MRRATVADIDLVVNAAQPARNALAKADRTIWQLTSVLLAVLDLHANDGYGDCTGCTWSEDHGVPYPRDTVETIRKALA